MVSEERKRLEKWILTNEEKWNTICGKGKHPITKEEFQVLYQELIAQGLDSIVLVLVTCHGYAIYDQLLDRMTSLRQDRAEELQEERLPS